MPERIVTPGVYTKEIDQSTLPGAIAQIGAAIVGPTQKGPVLSPTVITSFRDFTKIFGSYTADSYVPYAVKEYLDNGGNAINVTRLLYEGGYTTTNGVLAVIAKSGSVSKVTHVLHPTNTTAITTDFTATTLSNYQSGSFAINLTGSGVTLHTGISASINPDANNYVTKVFGTSPKSTIYPVYVQYEDKTAYSAFANLGSVTTEIAKFSTYSLNTDTDSAANSKYNHASTPWITSQKIGTAVTNLFRFHTLSQGTDVNQDVKVGIKDIKTSSEISDPDGYPTFTVVVRRVNTSKLINTIYNSSDTDNSPEIVEEFNVSLNPNSTKYISLVIGDKYNTISSDGDLISHGSYENLSNYIRVEVDSNVESGNLDKTLIPFGFRAVYSPIPMASGSVNLAAAQFVVTQSAKTTYHGFDFNNTLNLNYLAPLVDSAVTASNTDFYLGNVTQQSFAGAYTGSLENSLTSGSFSSDISLTTRKFIVPFQGGYDGAQPNLVKNSGADITSGNVFGFNCATSTSTGTTSYKKAFALLANTDYYDINLLLTPGINLKDHTAVTSEAIQLVEDRQDTFYIVDPGGLTDSIATVKSKVLTVDSSYTAAYYPWVRIKNPSNGLPLWVPPSVVMPGVLAFNDANAAPWWAPAGLIRGGLTSVSDTYINLSQTTRGTLYEARINPIANFPSVGICVWGQKTLQARTSALSSVNVRRMLIAVKKYIASATRYLVFEQNTDQTRLKFENIVNPYLSAVAAKQGLYAFKVIMDQSNNTNDLIDQNILYGQLFLQPTRTAEYILLDFNIQSTGASFPE